MLERQPILLSEVLVRWIYTGQIVCVVAIRSSIFVVVLHIIRCEGADGSTETTRLAVEVTQISCDETFII